MLNWLLKRAREPSTWAGIGLAVETGRQIATAPTLSTGLVGALGTLAVVLGEGRR